MKETDSVLKNSNITQIRSKLRCPSPVTDTNLFVKAKGYPFTSLETTPSNLNSTIIGWEALKFC